MRLCSSLTALAFSSLATLAIAQDTPKPVQQHNSNAVWFENWVGLNNTTMTVADPIGKITAIHADSGTPVFKLEGGEIVDGIYRYEIKAATKEVEKIVNQIDNGRGKDQKDTTAKPYFLSGYFTVSRGVIVTPDDVKEE